MASETGQRVGDYEVLALLGTGGMGRVYKVRSVISNREEAMKILLPDFAAEPELAQRFMVEIRTLAGLDHPNITQLRTAFQIQNQFVMVMEFVEGATLDRLSAQLPVEQVIDYSMQVLSALSYAHGKGVTHRDIKPANIMITTHGVVKLMDFGIAKSTSDLNLTRPGTTMGSIYYMSPEQVRGGTVDGRTDIYSFGVTLYEMLTGRKPFEAETSYSVLNAQLNEAPTPPVQWNPSLSPQLNDIVLLAMAKDPAARFQTADEFRNALKALREPKAAPAAAVAAMPLPFAAPAQGLPQTTFPPLQQPALDPGPLPAQTNPGLTPVFTPASVEAALLPASGKSRRGLWIGVGALVAVLAVVAAFAVLPHFFATHAGQKSGPAAVATQTAANTPPTEPAAAPATTEAQPAGTPPAVLTPAPVAPVKPSPPAASSSYDQPPAPVLAQDSEPGRDSSSFHPPMPAGSRPDAMRRARDRLMDLNGRAQDVKARMEQLHHHQRGEGNEMRGDMAGSLNKANNALREADRALNDGNVDIARDYMDHAGEEIRKLEEMLNR